MRQEDGTFAAESTIAVACTFAVAAEDFIGLAVDDDATQFGFAGELICDVSRPLHASDVAPEGEHFHLDAELVAGRDLLTELAFINTREQHELRIRLELARDEQAAGLRNGLDDEHTRHHRMTREM